MLDLERSDHAWSHFGATDPYWGVLTDDRFRSDRIDDAARAEFFRTGEDDIEKVFATIRARLEPAFAPESCLDFGCGVGRLLVPLARRCRSAVGLDIADGMLAEANANLRRFGLHHAEARKSDDELSAAPGPFDLVVSLIVLQHIPAERGGPLFARLVSRLRPGGIGAIQVTYSKAYGDAKAAWPAAGDFDPPAPPPPPPGVRGSLAEVAAAGRRWVGKRVAGSGEATGLPEQPAAPKMEMNAYTLNPLLHGLQAAGVRSMHVEFTDHGGEWGVQLFFRKEAA